MPRRKPTAATSKPTPAKRGAKKKTSKSVKTKRVSKLRQPEEMSLERWQVALRRQFGQEQNFGLKNEGQEPFFSEFTVTNPTTEGRYRVAIRGLALGDNFCSCPDFAVNTLGTCKHIEFTLAKLQRKRGGKKAFSEGFQPSYSEVYLRYGAKRQVVFRPGRQCPKSLRTLASAYFSRQGVLGSTGIRQFDQFMKKAARIRHDLRCYPDALTFIAQVRDGFSLQKRIDRAFPKGIKSPAFKSLLKVSLYPYQRHGVLFAARAGRMLLADDMGLGKTIQAIGVAEVLARTAGIERVLIVAPTSLKHQWQEEIGKFCGRASTVIEGLIARRAALYRETSFYKVTNYDVIHRDLDAIAGWAPDLIILDEAQRIKNWKTRAAQSVKQLNSKFALVLTGTPLENRLEELHSIVEFVDRFHLGPLFQFLADHQTVDEDGKVVGYRNLSKIAVTLEPIMMRRTRDEVLKELPKRLDKNYFVPMTPEQSKHHAENQETVARIVQKWRRMHFLSESDQLRMRIALQNMRMSCNSTYLLDQETDFGIKADEFVSVISEVLEQPGTKVVVFSQWRRTHELLCRRLETMGEKFILFHGQIPGPKRQDLIKQFKTDPEHKIFLSTDAGGVGLNLQNASIVINMDLPWNPAVLEQRIGRVHRLGQSRPVRVINFVAKGTIEEGMLSVLSFKKSLFAGVLDNGQDEVFLGGTRLKQFMETVEKTTGSISEPMPSQTEASDSDEMKGAEPPADSTQQAWNDLLSTGLSFLENFSRSLTQKKTNGGKDSAESSPLALRIETDAQTGERCLKVPVPSKEAISGVANLLIDLAKRLQ